jgi:hypothetical protein
LRDRPAAASKDDPESAEVVATTAARPSRLRRGSARTAAFAIALLTFFLVALTGRVERLAGGDETVHLARLSSLVEDGDLDVRNDVLWATLPPTELRRLLVTSLPSGHLGNPGSIGPALLFAPIYLLTYPARLLADTAAARWSWVQLVGLHLFAVALVFWVLWWLRCWLRRLGLGSGVALLATAALGFGTPLVIYGFWQYAGAQLLSTVVACAALGAAVRLDRRQELPSALLLGVLLGLAFAVRGQDLVLLAVLLPIALRLHRQRTPWRRRIALAGTVLAGFGAVASVQLHAWIVERAAFLSPPWGSGFQDWSEPKLAEFLFSGFRGVLVWSPLVVLSFLGLLLPWRLRLPRRWALVALLVLAGELTLDAATSDWWEGASYGARSLTSTLPFLALGLANLLRQRGIEGVPDRMSWRRHGSAVVLLVVCLWGTMTAQLYRRGVEDLGLVFLGRASVSAAVGEADSDPAAARRALGFPWQLRLPDYLDASGWRAALGRVLSATLLAAALAQAARLAVRRWRRDAVWVVASLLLALAGAAHVRLALGPRTDAEERTRWRAFASAATSPTPGHALLDREMRRFEETPDASAGDPYRYLYLWSLWQRNRAGKALAQLDLLATRGYPAARELVELGKLAGPGGTIRLAVPGALLGRGDSELRFHLRGERALFAKRVVIVADVTLLAPPGGERPLLALLAGPTVMARLDLRDGDTVLITPAVELQVPASWAGRQVLRFTWDGPSEEVTVERQGGGILPDERVTAPGAAPANYAVDELSLAFAPAMRADGQPGLAVANLFVATAPR